MVASSTVLTTVSSHCICPGHEAVFECTVDDGVTTIWQGSALEIVLTVLSSYVIVNLVRDTLSMSHVVPVDQ